ncbi:MAG: hypothetical protein R3E88_05810 [Myxococcota bacterium]
MGCERSARRIARRPARGPGRTRAGAIACAVAALAALAAAPAAADEVTDAYLASRAALDAGDLDAATRHAERALRLGRAQRADDDPELAALGMNAGQLLLGGGQTLEAVDAFRTAVRAYERIHGKDAIELSGPLRALAVAQSRNGETSAARLTHERRVALVAASAGDPSVALADALRDAATAERDARQGRRARKLLERAIASYEAAGEQGELLARAKIELGFVELMNAPTSIATRKRAETSIRDGLWLLEHAFPLGSDELVEVYEQIERRLERAHVTGGSSKLAALVEKRLERHRVARARRR